MAQIDIFGDEGPMVTNVKMPTQAADYSRRSDYTCWEHCDHCEPKLLGNARKVYRRCSRVGSKCFPTSEVCEWSSVVDSVVATKPNTPGWDDF